MTISALHAATGFVACWSRFVDVLPDAWERHGVGAYAHVTGIPIPTFNGAMVTDPAADPDHVLELMAQVMERGVPCSVQGSAQVLEALAARLPTLVPDVARPLMVREPGTGLEGLQEIPGFDVHRVTSTDLEGFITVGSTCFGATPELFALMFNTDVLAAPGFAAYLGVVEGDPVATGCTITTDDVTSVFTVGTLPEHRGKGYGAAMTARCTQDGYDAGSAYTLLQSSVMGFPVYQRMGFRTVDTWPILVTSS